MDTYYNLPDVSNSDLTALLQYFNPTFTPYNPEIAFKFGNLVDYSITEPHKVNFFKRTIEGYAEPFTPEAWETAMQMKAALKKDSIWKLIAPFCIYQAIFRRRLNFEYSSMRFNLNMRCKYDFFLLHNNWGGDLKTTTATTDKQFRDVCVFFDYIRSRVLYMLLSGSARDMIIGISKKNLKIFKIYITRGDVFWKSGYEKLVDLAFKYWILYENFN
jgi:hypothetical protein